MNAPAKPRGETQSFGGTTDDPTLRIGHSMDGISRKGWLLLYLIFAFATFVIYWPAMHGEFISDDFHIFVNNPYLNPLNFENLVAILNPFGAAVFQTANYEPVHLLIHSAERALFGTDTFGYHAINVLIHALNAVLLVALLVQGGIPRIAALVGGSVFLVHPANVEAVAWISQLKTSLAFAFCFGAILAHERRPKSAVLLFALGLLCKASAATALPMAMAFAWSRQLPARRWAWLGVWALIFSLFAIPEIRAHRHAGSMEIAAYTDSQVHIQTIGAIGARYLMMAATSYGISAFQEIDPVFSPTHRWWIAGLVAGLFFVIRIPFTLRARRMEAGYWIAAAASWVPISQISPFLHPMCDRYLYFILPGLIGGTLHLAGDLRDRFATSAGTAASGSVATWAVRATLAAIMLLTLYFGAISHSLAPLWQRELNLVYDVLPRYPDGGAAAYWRARIAAQKGDVETTVAELWSAADHGIFEVRNFSNDSAFDPVRGHPAFQQFFEDLAGRWIEEELAKQRNTQSSFLTIASAHFVREEFDEAIEYYERAMRAGGPLESKILVLMEGARRERRKLGEHKLEAGVD